MQENDKAFALLWAINAPMLRKYLLSRHKMSPQILDDVVNETALFCWQHFDPDQTPTFGTWICSVGKRFYHRVLSEDLSAGTGYNRNCQARTVSLSPYERDGEDEEGRCPTTPIPLRAEVRLPKPDSDLVYRAIDYLRHSAPDLSATLDAMLVCLAENIEPSVRKVAEMTGQPKTTTARKIDKASTMLRLLVKSKAI